MSLLVQDDNGSVDGAMAYIDAEFLKEYALARGTDLAETYIDEQLEVSIVKATDYVDQRWRFIGERIKVAQRTSWPRNGAEDVDGNIRFGIPSEVKEATAEYAIVALSGELNANPTREASGQRVASFSKTVGPLSKSVSFAAGGAWIWPDYPKADSKLSTSGLILSGRNLRLA